MPIRRTPLSFTITITPRATGGHEAQTSPHHQMIEETIEEAVCGRVSVRTTRATIISALADRTAHPRADGPIAPNYVRRGILQLAAVGAEELCRANCIVEGYLYDAVVTAVVGSLRERGVTEAGTPTGELDDGPVPQMRTLTRWWWRDVQHVLIARDGGSTIRLRGIPRSEAFSSWGNARIRAAFERRLDAALRSSS